MPIILNNGEIFDQNKLVVDATPRPVISEVLEKQVIEEIVVETQPEQPVKSGDNHVIIVNGKKKNLKVKSSYLLDMLTSE